MGRRDVGLLLMAGMAATFAGAAPLRADSIFSSLFTSHRETEIGAWTTTVRREPGAVAVAAADPRWTATVAAVSSRSDLITGSIGRAPARVALPGPRLTGKSHALTGQASYYWEDQMTATGEHFNKRAMTAAHKTLPFGTRVKVTRVDTGNSVVVRINDRGPYIQGRIIDLSEKAAENLGMTNAGVTPVKLEVLGQ